MSCGPLSIRFSLKEYLFRTATADLDVPNIYHVRIETTATRILAELNAPQDAWDWFLTPRLDVQAVCIRRNGYPSMCRICT